ARFSDAKVASSHPLNRPGAAGNTTTNTQTLTVNNPNGTPPTISLTAPAKDANITSPTAVTGSVSDDHVGVSYTVTVVPFDGSPSGVVSCASARRTSRDLYRFWSRYW